MSTAFLFFLQCSSTSRGPRVNFHGSRRLFAASRRASEGIMVLMPARPATPMSNGPIALRLATLADSDLLLLWRNDALTRQNSHSMAEVDRNSHQAWLLKSLADPTRIIFIGEVNGSPVGTVRCDCRNTSPVRIELSWTVAPEHRGRGYGRKLVEAAAELFAAQELYAEIKNGNAASIAIARSVGMKQVGEKEGVTFWARPAITKVVNANVVETATQRRSPTSRHVFPVD
jgi:RimJ/RimL family protein N-acetyltransferase